MLKEKFKDKIIACVGASNTHEGEYVYAMRSYIKTQTDKCYFLTRGIAGNRASLAKFMIDEDVIKDKPDYAIFTFGTNDVGVWLYDADKEENAELTLQRNERIEEHKNCINEMFTRCLDNGITPIYCTVPPVNERIDENAEIKTVGDNKEKSELVKNTFYQRESFRRVNNGLKNIAKVMQKYCLDNGFDFIDLITPFHKEMLVKNGLYQEDGIHLTQKGHDITARVLLEFLGYEDKNFFYKKYNDLDELQALENAYNGAQFFLRPTYVPENTPDVPTESYEDRLKLVEDIHLFPEKHPDYSVRYAKYAYGNLDKLSILRKTIKIKATKV